MERQKLAYHESAGTGPDVVLVHGNSCSGEAFAPQLEGELGENTHLIAFDLPGHGLSDPAPEFADYSMAGYARVLNDAVQQLGLKNAVYVGWSLGGHIVLEMSVLEMSVLDKSVPEMSTDLSGAKGMMIFGTPPLGFPPDMEKAFLPTPELSTGMKGEVTKEEAYAYAATFFTDETVADETIADNREALIEFTTGLIFKTDPNARLGLGQNMGPDTYHDELKIVKELEIPLAILHGTGEKLVNLEYIRSLEMPTLWKGEVQMINQAGHAPQLENVEVFNQLLAEFVTSVQ